MKEYFCREIILICTMFCVNKAILCRRNNEVNNLNEVPNITHGKVGVYQNMLSVNCVNEERDFSLEFETIPDWHIFMLSFPVLPKWLMMLCLHPYSCRPMISLLSTRNLKEEFTEIYFLALIKMLVQAEVYIGVVLRRSARQWLPGWIAFMTQIWDIEWDLSDVYGYFIRLCL